MVSKPFLNESHGLNAVTVLEKEQVVIKVCDDFLEKKYLHSFFQRHTKKISLPKGLIRVLVKKILKIEMRP